MMEGPPGDWRKLREPKLETEGKKATQKKIYTQHKESAPGPLASNLTSVIRRIQY